MVADLPPIPAIGEFCDHQFGGDEALVFLLLALGLAESVTGEGEEASPPTRQANLPVSH